MRAARLTTWIGMSVLLLVGCATVHPDFEKYFNAEYQGHEYYNDSPDHAEWMQLAATRYGCDTMPLRTAIRDQTACRSACRRATSPAPFRPARSRRSRRRRGSARSGATAPVPGRWSSSFEGTTPRTLRTSFIQWY